MIPKEVERATEINFVAKCDRCFFIFEKREEGVPVSKAGWDGNVVCGTFVRNGVISGDSGNDETQSKAARNPKRVAPRKQKAGVWTGAVSRGPGVKG